MLKEIKTHREQIAELCRRYGVKRLELFGSATRGLDFEPGPSACLSPVNPRIRFTAKPLLPESCSAHQASHEVQL